MFARFAPSHVLRPALIATLLGLTAPAAFAQGEDGTPYTGGPNETVTVTGPHFRADRMPLNGPLEGVSLSRAIHYTTADLLDPQRAQALRWQVWQTAHEVCQQLDEAYPVYRLSSTRACSRDAYNDAIVKIDARITGARLAYWYGY